MTRTLIIVAALVIGAYLAPSTSAGSAPLSGPEVMARVNARSRGMASEMQLEMTIRDAKRGDFRKNIVLQRRRLSSGYRTAYWITAPDHEKDIALLLSEDAAQRGMWMYFPASRQLVPVVGRGLSALASDFSCEDLLVEVPLADYEFRTLGSDTVDGVPALKVEMVPRSDRLRSEVGFSKSIGWVRTDIWLIARADYYDEGDKPFKTFYAEDVALVQGVWTVRRFRMENHRARHSSDVRVLGADYRVRLTDDSLTPSRLAAGPFRPRPSTTACACVGRYASVYSRTGRAMPPAMRRTR